jgi:hypothetical protein
MIKLIENKVFYPNGVEVSDASIDLSKALDFMYGTDRDKDIKSYTQDMKQRAINYWIKKTDGMLKESKDYDIKFIMKYMRDNGISKEDLPDEVSVEVSVDLGKLRPMKGNDFMGYQGATGMSLADGSGPFIYEGERYDIQLTSNEDDENEIVVSLIPADPYNITTEYYKIYDRKDIAIRFANKVIDILDKENDTIDNVALDLGFNMV